MATFLPREGSFMETLGSALGAGAQQYGQQKLQQQQSQAQMLQKLLPQIQKKQGVLDLARSLPGATPQTLSVLESMDPQQAFSLVKEQIKPRSFWQSFPGMSSPRPFELIEQGGSLQDILQGVGLAGQQPQEAGMPQQRQLEAMQPQQDENQFSQAIDMIAQSDLSPEKKAEAIAQIADKNPNSAGILGYLGGIGKGLLKGSLGGVGSLTDTLSNVVQSISQPSNQMLEDFFKQRDPLMQEGQFTKKFEPPVKLPTVADIQDKFNLHPKTLGERRAQDLGEFAAYLVRPDTWSPMGVAKGLGQGLKKAGIAKLFGKIGEMTTGSPYGRLGGELFGLAASNFLGKNFLNDVRFEKYDLFNKALKQNAQPMEAENTLQRLGKLGNEYLYEGANELQASKDMVKRIGEFERTANKNMIDPKKALKVYQTHQKAITEIPQNKRLYRQGMRELLDIEKDFITKAGEKFAPEMLQNFKSAEDITLALGKDSNVKKFFDSNVPKTLMFGPLRFFMRMGSALVGGVGDKIEKALTVPAIRDAYLTSAQAALQENKRALAIAAKNLNRAIKEHDPKLLRELQQRGMRK